MNIYRFVGRHCIIGEREFSEFGQKAEFTEDQFLEISKKCAFITEDEFLELNIPSDHLIKYASVNYYGAIPQAFQDKIEAAREKFRQMHASLHA